MNVHRPEVRGVEEKLQITSVKVFNLDGSIYMEYDPSRSGGRREQGSCP